MDNDKKIDEYFDWIYNDGRVYEFTWRNDFSEKYRTKPSFLDERAKELIKTYRFPGNIRQLKNIAEQISILEIEREVTAEVLMKYLPTTPGENLPAVISEQKESENFSERDILYKVLFDMKKDMTDMKRLILQLIQENPSKSEILQEHEHLFNEIPASEQSQQGTAEVETTPLLLNSPSDDYEDIVEDIEHDTEEETSLSLEKKEKELIMLALKKNNNRRKHAAQDLGISERTLYRKIKQYEIDNS